MEILEFAQFKWAVYQKILGHIFSSLGWRSQCEEAHLCNNDIKGILYLGILIGSQDVEEASYFCACQAANANYPCPKCLVHKSELHCITKTFWTMDIWVHEICFWACFRADHKDLQGEGSSGPWIAWYKDNRPIHHLWNRELITWSLALFMGPPILWFLYSIFI